MSATGVLSNFISEFTRKTRFSAILYTNSSARAAASDESFVSCNFSLATYSIGFIFIEMKVGTARFSYCEIEDNK